MKKKKTWIIAAIAIVVIIAVCWTLSGTKANSQVDFVTEKHGQAVSATLSRLQEPLSQSLK